MGQGLLIAAFVAMAGVVVTLLIGVFAMGRGRDWNKSHANTLMRIRVGLQLIAVALLIAAMLVSTN